MRKFPEMLLTDLCLLVHGFVVGYLEGYDEGLIFEYETELEDVLHDWKYGLPQHKCFDDAVCNLIKVTIHEYTMYRRQLLAKEQGEK